MNPNTPHPTRATPSRPGRSFVALSAILATFGVIAFPVSARANDAQIPALEVISAQYQPPSVTDVAAQTAAVVAQAETAVAAATAPASEPVTAPTPPPPPPPEPPAPMPNDSINATTIDTSDTPDITSAPAAADPEPAAPSTAEPAPQASPPPATQDAGDGTAAEAAAAAAQAAQAAQSAAQSAASDASAAAHTAVEQLAPTNLNVAVRVNSPGNDGPVTQTNGGANPSPAVATPTAPDGTGVAVGATGTGALPTTWIWNWTWGTSGCGSTAPTPSASTIAGGIWTWNWTWGCAPAPPERIVNTPMTSAPVAAAVALVDGLMGQPATATPAQPASPVTTSAPPADPPAANRQVAGATKPGIDTDRGEPGDTAARNPLARTLVAMPRASSRAVSAVAQGAATISRRTLTRGPRDLVPPLGIATPSAAAVSAAGAAGGGGLIAATLLALIAFFAPKILLPLWTAPARRPSLFSARHERPG